MNDIRVSILCAAYNQEQYIRDALKGFVMQRADFAFEVLVNDDASTDATASIIQEYERKYPEIIRGVYQKGNQYSKGVSIIRDILVPLSKGDYIALCEGDDYWTDPYKLQKQYDALCEHPEVAISAHRTEEIMAGSGRHHAYIAPYQEDAIIPESEVILGGGAYVATGSLMYKRSIETDAMECLKLRHMDYFIQICGGLESGMLYLNDCMSVYRRMAKGSWSKTVSLDKDKIIEGSRINLEALRLFDEETDHRYEEEVREVMTRIEFGILGFQQDIRAIMQPPYKELYDRKSLWGKCKLQLKCRLPFAMTLRKWIRGNDL